MGDTFFIQSYCAGECAQGGSIIAIVQASLYRAEFAYCAPMHNGIITLYPSSQHFWWLKGASADYGKQKMDTSYESRGT